MDPNAALNELMSFFSDLEEKLQDLSDEDFDSGEGIQLDAGEVSQAIDLWDGLHRWMSSGGFLPSEWSKMRDGK